MSAGPTVCPTCGYENIVIGCGFCLQCGAEFPHITASVERSTGSQQVVGASEHVPAETQAGEDWNVTPANSADACQPALPTSEGDVFMSASANSVAEPSFDEPVNARPEATDAADFSFRQPGNTDAGEETDGQDSVAVAEVIPSHEDNAAPNTSSALPPAGLSALESCSQKATETASDQEFAAEFASARLPAGQVAVDTDRAAADGHADSSQAVIAEQQSYAAALYRELDRMIAAAAAAVEMQLRTTDQGLVGEIYVEGRKQNIYVYRNQSSSGVPWFSFFAACGPAAEQHARPLLEWNSALPQCAFAIREIGSDLKFVVQANLPAFSLNSMLIAETFQEIAKRADQVQRRIG